MDRDGYNGMWFGYIRHCRGFDILAGFFFCLGLGFWRLEVVVSYRGGGVVVVVMLPVTDGS
jgi:hypothetical protein